MEEKFIDALNDDQEKEDLPLGLKKDVGLAKDNSLEFTVSKFRRPLERVKQEQTLTSDVKHSHVGERCIRKSFLQSRGGADVTIPKHIRFGSVSEKHIQQCLDLVEVRAFNSLSIAGNTSTACNIAVKLTSSKMENLFDSLKPIKSRRRNGSDLGSFVIKCPSAAGQGNVVISPIGEWLVGAIAGKDNVRDILKSPLFCQLGALDSDMNLGKMSSIDVKGTRCSDFMSSPSDLRISSSQKPEKKTVPLGDWRYGLETLHKRLVSISSTNSTCSDQSSSACAPVSRGMLYCTWKNGIPYFVFSVDDQREVYAANLWKVESSDDKALDYMYSFHSRTDGQKEHGAGFNALDLVGKMKVSSSFIFDSNNSKLMETEFVLFGANENHFGELQSSTPIKKNRRLPNKVVDMLRTKHPVQGKTGPKFGVASSIVEDFSWEPCQDMFSKLDALGRVNILESHLSPNLELAAIVVRDVVHDNHHEAAVGGWGLQFLKKVKVEHANTPLEDSASLESCQESCLRNKNDCSTSMNVLVPAGFHGGPQTRNGGPSSLTERWRSGGHCDCGGWDIGCSFTILNNRSNKGVLPRADAQEECKSFDLFMQDAKQDIPTLRMVSIHDGLYFIDFQSTLSALQSFSIGVAIIHARSPTLSPKSDEKLK